MKQNKVLNGIKREMECNGAKLDLVWGGLVVQANHNLIGPVITDMPTAFTFQIICTILGWGNLGDLCIKKVITERD